MILMGMKAVKGAAMRQVHQMQRKNRQIYRAAVRSAMGRAVTTARGAGRRAVAQSAGIKLKAVSGRVSRSKIRLKDWSASVSVYFHHKPMPLEAFAAPRQTKSGARAGRHTVDGGFLARASRGRASGKETVFKRDGQARGPISRQMVDISQHRDQWVAATKRAFDDVFPRRLAHEINRRMKAERLK